MQITTDRHHTPVAAPETPTPDEWDQFVLKRIGHLLQSWGWGEFKGRFGWEPDRLVVRDEATGELRGAAQVLIRRMRLGSMGYVPKGPVVDPADRETWVRLLRALRGWGRQRGVAFIKIEPDWEGDHPLADVFVEEGYTPAVRAVQPPTTILVSLEEDEEQILQQMKSKTRYNIRLAQRKGVTVREGDEGQVSLFYELMEETKDRDAFGIHEEAYYREAWRTFAPEDRARLFLAYYEDEPLAGLMAFAFGSTAYYLYGASSNRRRNLMPNHLLQWRAMSWAREMGCTTYDLWGVPDEVGEEEEDMDEVLGRGGLWGVYRFKRGFGGRVARYSRSYDYVYSPILYWLGARVYPLVRGMYSSL